MKRCIASILSILSILFSLSCDNQAPAVSPHPPIQSPAASLYPHIEGNKFFDEHGKQVTLRGVSLWELEFGCNQDGHYQTSDFQAMKSWGINAVRLLLNATSWLSGADGCSAQEYQTEAHMAVTNAEKQGLYVMLVLQWAGPHSDQNEPMAYPQDKTFWQQVASAYANDTHVGFVPVTEPDHVSWDQWYNGWHGGPGMKKLIQIIGDAAPHNIIFVNGLGGGNDVTFLTNKYAITGPTIAYEVHIYDAWANGLTEELMQKYFIIAGEYGIQNEINLVAQTMTYFETHQTGYFAWLWTTSPDEPGAGVQYLLDDWSGAPRNNLVGRPTYDFLGRHNHSG